MKYTLIILFLLFLNSCNKIMCGDLPQDLEKQLLKARNNYPQFEINNIPCESYYINLRLKGDRVDTTSIHLVHKTLYNVDTNTGWRAIMVFNKEDKYLFTHNFDNNIFIQKGD